MATLSDNIPQASNPGLGDVLKMEDNFEMYNLFFKGYLKRAKFAFASITSITVNPGVYEHNGTTRQCCYWNSALTFVLGAAGSNAASSALGTSCWQYIYIDDSAVVTAGTNLLTQVELLNSTTAPTYSVTKQGLYNGLDRCIFFVYINAAGEVSEFYHDGSNYFSIIGITVQTGTTLTTSFANSSALTYPSSVCSRVQGMVHMQTTIASAFTSEIYYRSGWSSSTAGTYLGIINDNTAIASIIMSLTPDGSGYVQFKASTAASGVLVTLVEQGYYLREGL
jgi:hypothetical protein